MGAGNADAVLIQPAHIAQHHAALHTADTVGLSGLHPRVVVMDGGGVHHQICAQHVFGFVAHEHLNAHVPLAFDDGTLVHIAAGNGVALGCQNLHQGEHTAAADADEVEPVDSLQQTSLIAAGMICHSQSPQCHKV